MINSEIKCVDIAKSVLSLFKEDTGKAIMIDGVWGIGKTWFINHEFLEELQKDKKLLDYVLIKVSLFGLANVEELKQIILTRIIVEQIPKDGNLGVVLDASKKALDGKISNSVMDTMKKWGGLGKNILSQVANHYGVDLSKINSIDTFLEKDSKFIFCFDDFERISNLENSKEFLGFFNWLTEIKNQKLIVLCNEKELCDKVDEYKDFKEKVINKTIIFDRSIVEIEDILIASSSEEEKVFLKQGVFFPFYDDNFSEKNDNNLEKNIRTIKKCLLNANDFLKHTDKFNLNKEKKIAALQCLTILTMEYESGNLNEFIDYQFLKSISYRALSSKSEDNYKYQELEKRLINLYGIVLQSFRIYKSIYNYVKRGYFHSEELEDDFIESEISLAVQLESEANRIFYSTENDAKELLEKIVKYISQANNLSEWIVTLRAFYGVKYALMGEDKEISITANEKELFVGKYQEIISRESFDKLRDLYEAANVKSRAFGGPKNVITEGIETVLKKYFYLAYKQNIKNILMNEQVNNIVYTIAGVNEILSYMRSGIDAELEYKVLSRLIGNMSISTQRGEDYSEILGAYITEAINTKDLIKKHRYQELEKLYEQSPKAI